ncbi:MAG: hypothetical protein II047_05955, partial [Bacteroidales bacterium]|nr:hypothetical protein [Bacteroidales bacterium]
MMDLDLFLEILGIDSTSGQERGLAEFLKERLAFPAAGHLPGGRGAQGGGGESQSSAFQIHEFEVGDGTVNLLLDWSGTGKPRFVFCSHMDTVP